jgi:hypothetical protein
LTLRVQLSEAELGLGITLQGCPAIPLRGFGVVLRDAFAFLVERAEIEPGLGIALLGQPTARRRDPFRVRRIELVEVLETVLPIAGRAWLQTSSNATASMSARFTAWPSMNLRKICRSPVENALI